MADRGDPVIYSFRRCPYAMRARLALAVSGTRCELREVRLSAKPPAMLAASPKGTVPVLVLPDGHVIDESIDIMRWALGQSDPEGWLHRDDPDLIAMNDGPFKYDLDRFKYPDRHGAIARNHRENALTFLSELESRLTKNDQLSGNTRGLTDAAIFPFVRQFSAVDQEWFDRLPFPHLKSWLAAHLSCDLFDAIMTKVHAWTEGDTPISLKVCGVMG